MFERVVQGKINKQIAHQLGATERTIKAHRQRVMEKMKVQTLAELVSIAERLGMLAHASNESELALIQFPIAGRRHMSIGTRPTGTIGIQACVT